MKDRNHRGQDMLCQMRYEVQCREREKKFLWMPRDRSIYRALWVRTRESRGGLSKRGKGGLLHSQLVELGQLLKG